MKSKNNIIIQFFLVKLQGEAKFVLVIQKHPKLVTYKAQAYRIRCVYNTGEQNLNIGFNVSTLTTAGTIANTGPAPTCTMRICNSNGDDISQAEIGDQLMLKVEVKNYPYFIYFFQMIFSFKGQLISKCLFGVIVLTKIATKILLEFLP